MPGPSLPGHVAIVIHLSCWRFGSWPLHFCALCHYSLRAAHHTFLLSTHFPFQYLLWVPGSFTVTCPIDLLLCEALALFPMTSHCPLVFKSVLPSHWVIWSFPSLLPVVWPERTFPLIPIWPKIAHCSPPQFSEAMAKSSCLLHAWTMLTMKPSLLRCIAHGRYFTPMPSCCLHACYLTGCLMLKVSSLQISHPAYKSTDSQGHVIYCHRARQISGVSVIASKVG